VYCVRLAVHASVMNVTLGTEVGSEPTPRLPGLRRMPGSIGQHTQTDITLSSRAKHNRSRSERFCEVEGPCVRVHHQEHSGQHLAFSRGQGKRKVHRVLCSLGNACVCDELHIRGLSGSVTVFDARLGCGVPFRMAESDAETPRRATGWSTYRETLWGPLIWGVDGVLLLLAYGDLAAKLFPDSENLFKKLAVLSSLPWYWKVIIILVANILLMGRGALTALRKRELQRDSYAAQLSQIEKARPRLVLRDADAEHVAEIGFVNRATGKILGTFLFVKVRFINKPLGAFPDSLAESIRAKVKFYSADDSSLPLEMDRRWDDSDQPFTREFGTSRNDLLATNFGIEQEHGLDIAYKDPISGQFIAFNNDNYDYADLRKPEHVLGTSFIVAVRLVGVWVDEDFCFAFSDTPTGVKITRPIITSVTTDHSVSIFGKD
jgi:hypothetical protein